MELNIVDIVATVGQLIGLAIQVLALVGILGAKEVITNHTEILREESIHLRSSILQLTHISSVPSSNTGSQCTSTDS